MAVVLVFQGPTLTKEKYAEIVRRITEGKDQMESPSDWPVDGLLVHLAGEAKQGFRVVDIWESEEAAQRNAAALAPILQGVGMEEEPEIYPAQALVSA
jgi:hypothetical protein